MDSNALQKVFIFFVLLVSLDRSFGPWSFFPNFADEILVIMLIILSAFLGKKTNFDNFRYIFGGFISFFIFVLLGCFWGVFFSGNSFSAIIADFIEYSKPVIVFLLFSTIKIEKSVMRFAEKTFVLSLRMSRDIII